VPAHQRGKRLFIADGGKVLQQLPVRPLARMLGGDQLPQMMHGLIQCGRHDQLHATRARLFS
jgi:hypothetical protein